MMAGPPSHLPLLVPPKHHRGTGKVEARIRQAPVPRLAGPASGESAAAGSAQGLTRARPRAASSRFSRGTSRSHRPAASITAHDALFQGRQFRGTGPANSPRSRTLPPPWPRGRPRALRFGFWPRDSARLPGTRGRVHEPGRELQRSSLGRAVSHADRDHCPEAIDLGNSGSLGRQQLKLRWPAQGPPARHGPDPDRQPSFCPDLSPGCNVHHPCPLTKPGTGRTRGNLRLPSATSRGGPGSSEPSPALDQLHGRFYPDVSSSPGYTPLAGGPHP